PLQSRTPRFWRAPPRRPGRREDAVGEDEPVTDLVAWDRRTAERLEDAYLKPRGRGPAVRARRTCRPVAGGPSAGTSPCPWTGTARGSTSAAPTATCS